MMIKYRPDIDGLRALAVLSVVVFHIDPKWLPGGFTGVDIFFAISGFLITKIIYQDVVNGSFSFSEFYKRRIKRILPVFFFVIIATAVVSFLLMRPDDYVYFTKTAVSTVFFWQNMFFGGNVDYFSSDVTEYPLLHTWSLAVEEQFYLIWPLIIILAMRLTRSAKWLIALGVAIAFVSFTVSQFSSISTFIDKYNYYSLFTRGGQLMIGAIAGLSSLYFKRAGEKVSSFMVYAGSIIIIGSITLLTESGGYPGYKSILPALGASLVMYFGGGKCLISKILSIKPVVIIGLISYSLYLWHWPTLSLMRYISDNGSLSANQLLAACIFMLSASFISWKFIEIPTRKSKLKLAPSVALFYLLPGAAVVALWHFSVLTGGFPEKYGADKERIVLETTYMYSKYCHNQRIGDCVFGDKKKTPSVLVIGDSHAGHYTAFIEKAGKMYGFSSKIETVDACPPLMDVGGVNASGNKKYYHKDCSPSIKRWTSELDKYSTVILAASYSSYFDDKNTFPNFHSEYHDVVKYLTQHGKRVLIMGQIPLFMKSTYDHAMRQRMSLIKFDSFSGVNKDLTKYRMKTNDKANNKLRKEAEYNNGARFLLPIEYLTKQEQDALPFYHGILAYKDRSHFNEYSARLIANDVLPKQREYWEWVSGK
ncbi:acyltransferase [Enterobacter hormaechei]|nr:acyltransferase [Enterobacter hormaechei]EKT9839836.1 acyltransferase [Enterobacter hormaechei]ELD3417232.1 acyltransferase [Enterobacter hormaechei]